MLNVISDIQPTVSMHWRWQYRMSPKWQWPTCYVKNKIHTPNKCIDLNTFTLNFYICWIKQQQTSCQHDSSISRIPLLKINFL